jgi:hypothetical protein
MYLLNNLRSEKLKVRLTKYAVALMFRLRRGRIKRYPQLLLRSSVDARLMARGFRAKLHFRAVYWVLVHFVTAPTRRL